MQFSAANVEKDEFAVPSSISLPSQLREQNSDLPDIAFIAMVAISGQASPLAKFLFITQSAEELDSLLRDTSLPCYKI